MPELFVVLRRNMSSMDLVDNEKSLRDEAKKLVKEQEDESAAKLKAEAEAEAERLRREEHERVMAQYRSKRKGAAFFAGMGYFIVVAALFLIMVENSNTLLANKDSINMRAAIREQLMGGCNEIESPNNDGTAVSSNLYKY